MKLSKSYKLLKFLNRKHNAFTRYSLAGLGWLGTAICTRSTILAAGISRDFLDDRFDIAFRKCARFARLFSAKLEFIHIPFFDFTQRTTSSERQHLSQQLMKKGELSTLSPDQLSDLLYILAEDIHTGINENIIVDKPVSEFYKIANIILSKIPNIEEKEKLVCKVNTGDFNKQDAVLALHDIAEMLPIDDWPWYIISGTFLGHHREGGFLKHDYDIDIGINAEDINVDKLIAHLKQQTSFAIQRIDNSFEIIKEANGQRSLDTRISIVKLLHPNGVPIDIFIHYTENGQRWHGSVIHKWVNTPFGLVRSTMEGVVVNCPDNADLYLSENYGQWQTPVTDFDCTTGTPNLTISHNFKSLALFIRRLAYFSAHDTQQAKKLLNTLQRSGVIKQEVDPQGNEQLSLALQL